MKKLALSVIVLGHILYLISCNEKVKSTSFTTGMVRDVRRTITPDMMFDTVQLGLVTDPVYLRLYENELWVKSFVKPAFEIINIESKTLGTRHISLQIGKGPGEVQQVYSFCRSDSRLFVTDISSFKILIYSFPQLNFLKEYALKERPIGISVIDSTILITTVGTENRIITIHNDRVSSHRDKVPAEMFNHQINPFMNHGEVLARRHKRHIESKSDSIYYIRSYLHLNRLSEVRIEDNFLIESILPGVGESNIPEVNITVSGKKRQFSNNATIMSIFHKSNDGYCAYVMDDRISSCYLDIYTANFDYRFSYEFKGFQPFELRDAIQVEGRIFLIRENFMLSRKL